MQMSKITDTGERAMRRGKEMFQRGDSAGSRSFSAMGRGLDRAAEAIPIDLLADRLHAAADALMHSSPKKVGTGMGRAMRAHPIRTAACAGAVGFVVYRIIRR